jgi:hypothetical protein
MIRPMSESSRRSYHLTLLIASILVAGLPWASLELIGDVMHLAPYQINDAAASFGLALFITGALAHRASDLLGALMQTAGLLLFTAVDHLGTSIGYWMAWVLVLATWLLVLKPGIFDRALDGGEVPPSMR